MSNSRGFHRGGRSSSGRGRSGRGYSQRDQGAYQKIDILDFKVGEKSNAIKLTKWMLKVREKISTKYSKYGLNNIITREGTIGYYEPPVEPEEPDDDATNVAVAKWKTKYGLYMNQEEDFKALKLACVADIYATIGEQSRNRLKEQNNKLAANDKFNMDDPISVLKLSVATHLTNANVDSDVNLQVAETEFLTIRMYQDEELSDYEKRYGILLSTYSNLLTEAEVDPAIIAAKLGDDKSQALRFVRGLDRVRFKLHVDKYEMKDKPYPLTVESAYEQAVSYVQVKLSGNLNANRKGIFLSQAIYSQPKGDGDIFNSGCYRCGAVGHYQNECKNKLSGKDKGGRGSDGGRGRGGRDNNHANDKKSGNSKDDSNVGKKKGENPN
jgi:hypothetical protein